MNDTTDKAGKALKNSIILLVGGSKQRQSKDIDTAKNRWADHKARKLVNMVLTREFKFPSQDSVFQRRDELRANKDEELTGRLPLRCPVFKAGSSHLWDVRFAKALSRITSRP